MGSLIRKKNKYLILYIVANMLGLYQKLLSQYLYIISFIFYTHFQENKDIVT